MRFGDIVSAPMLATACLVMFTCALQAPPNSADADSVGIKQTCAEFSQSFTRHDAHGVAMTFAEEADFSNMRGAHSHGRKDIENWFAGLFRGNLKDSVRTDAVRSVRFYSAEIAEVEAETVITGTKGPDGSEIPARKGLMIALMTKRDGRWWISSFHEAEYPALRGGANQAAGATKD
jgi:uncharacterized protein (TIGR02246 family)